jgi:protein-tyrosine phosphatase
VLLEQRWSEYNEDTPDVIRWFTNRGVTPIIPHPERHTFFRSEPKHLEECIEAGAWTQVSADSLLGKNTKDAEQFAIWLLEQDYVHTLATDAHNTNRKPNLSEGFAKVVQWSGAKRADEIMERLSRILAE